MKHIRLCAAIAAALLGQETLAQNTANSNASSSANPTSNASSASTGNTQSNTHSSANNSSSSANQTATASSSNSQNNGSASNLNANITVVTPSAASAGTTDSRLSQDVESSSHAYSYGEHRQYIDYGGSYTIKNVPNVSAPPLISSNDTCMGSASGGVSVAGFGITGGSTYTDEHCKRIKMSRELWNKGMKAASLALDCMDREAREALELTGFVCPQTSRAQRVALEEAAQRQPPGVWLAPVVTFPPPLPAQAAATPAATVAPVTATASAPVSALAAPAHTSAADDANVVIRRVDSGEAVRRSAVAN